MLLENTNKLFYEYYFKHLHFTRFTDFIIIAVICNIMTQYTFAQDGTYDDNEVKKMEIRDFCHQVSGWEWPLYEQGVYKSMEYPTQVDFKFYSSHPQYRAIDEAFYDTNGKLVRVNYVLRYTYPNPIYNTASYFPIKNEEEYEGKGNGKSFQDVAYDAMAYNIKNMFDNMDDESSIVWSAKRCLIIKSVLDDIRNNKYDIKKEPTEVKERILKQLSWFKVNWFMLRGGEGDRNSLFQTNNPADRIIRQLESDHEQDFVNVEEISRIDNLNFKVIFKNPQNGQEHEAQIKFYQNKPYDYKYQILLAGKRWMDSDKYQYKSVDEDIRKYYLKVK